MKLRYFLFLSLFILSGCASTDIQKSYTVPTAQKEVPAIVQQVEKVPVPVVNQVPSKVDSQPIDQAQVPKDVPLSNDNHYVNTAGNEVHSPAYAPSIPVGASARCGDSTYSFSQSRRGTCSHHGGVGEWL